MNILYYDIMHFVIVVGFIQILVYMYILIRHHDYSDCHMVIIRLTLQYYNINMISILYCNHYYTTSNVIFDTMVRCFSIK